MDPNAAIDDAREAYLAGRYREARELLQGYYSWRGKKGFEAENHGDKRARALSRALDDLDA